MVPDLTLEVIYLNEPTDFKMEFELCSSSNVRFLSLPVKSRVEFLTAISKSVVRSRAIIAVGSFNPLDKHYIPRTKYLHWGVQYRKRGQGKRYNRTNIHTAYYFLPD